MAEDRSLEVLFNPRSVAVIGASTSAGFPSRVPMFLKEFKYQGQIFPINPKYEELFGLKAYPSLAAVPFEIDLALVIVSAKNVLPVLEDCVAKGVKAAIVFSSGFAEVGPAGRELQDRMKELCARTGLRVLGPNCLGLVDFTHDLVATASSLMNRVKGSVPSSIGFVSQSGALGTMTYGEAYQQGKGFRCFVSTGNEVDIEVCECAAYLADDPAINVIGVYAESIKNPRMLDLAARKALAAGKPLAMVKVGRSATGARAAASHTGSIVGSDKVYDALLKQRGVLRAADIQELLDFMILASAGRIPRGNRIGVITISGGAGIMIADQCEELDIEIPELNQEAQERIRAIIPPFGASANPVDITAEVLARPEMFKEVLQIVVDQENIDMVVLFLGLVDELAPRLVEDIRDIYERTSKPMVVTWFAASEETMKALRTAGIPAYKDPARVVGATNLLINYRRILDKRDRGGFSGGVDSCVEGTRAQVAGWLKQLIEEGRVSLSEHESRKILEAYGIPVARAKLVTSSREAEEAAAELGFPVVMKIESPDILHKTDAGAIFVNLQTRQEAGQAFAKIMENARRYKPDAQLKGVLVEEMIQNGTEVILGVASDPTFGPTVMFGLGGVFVEVLKDVSFRVAPLSKEDAREMIQEIKGLKILRGARGRKPVDLELLADLLVRVGNMALDLQDMVAELDINPLIITPDGVNMKAADALFTLKKNSA